MGINDEVHEVHEIGWWPEIVGAHRVFVLIWLLMTFAHGSIQDDPRRSPLVYYADYSGSSACICRNRPRII